MELKICSKCGEEKSIREFGWISRRPSKTNKSKKRRNYWCKRCMTEYHRKWYQSNKERLREPRTKYCRQKSKIDNLYRLSKNISRRIRSSMVTGKSGNHWEDLLGYTVDDLRTHLESLFKENMTWDNYGIWHIDHCIPVSWFEEEYILEAWNLWNLQPMWGRDNQSKNNRTKSTIRFNCSRYKR